MAHIPRERDQIAPKLWERIVAVYRGESPWPLVLCGGVGSGKTCAAMHLLDCSRSRIYRPAARLATDIIAARCREVEYRESDIWSDWREAGVTCLDELGARGEVSDAHYEIVKMAIDERAGKPAIFISNKTIAELADLYDSRVASRLKGGTVVSMQGWPDRRVREKAAQRVGGGA